MPSILMAWLWTFDIVNKACIEQSHNVNVHGAYDAYEILTHTFYYICREWKKDKYEFPYRAIVDR